MVERIPPSVPPHPFEPGSPSFGLCLRLGRQRDDVRSSRTADKKFSKKVLTNQFKYAIIGIESEERIMNRTPMGRQLDFDLKYKMNNNDFIKFIEKEKKKVLTNQSKCGIMIIENKERGK